MGHYSEAQRHYHTLYHLQDMFELLDEYSSIVQNNNAVILSIIFHDVIYDPTRSDNEVESISVFTRFAEEAGLKPTLQEAVSAAIAATIKHTLPESSDVSDDLKLFLDFDLAVLGRGEKDYDVYAAQIRKEYGHFPDDQYKQGRATVLRRFLERKDLYFTATMRDRLENTARDNLRREIQSLEGSDGIDVVSK